LFVFVFFHFQVQVTSTSAGVLKKDFTMAVFKKLPYSHGRQRSKVDAHLGSTLLQ